VYLFIGLGVVALFAAIFTPVRRPEPKDPEAKVIPPALDSAPPFVLTERLGSTVDNDTLAGKVWVASFAFTRCEFCPQVSSTMARFRKEMNLTDRDDFRLVTFTIDPDHDTPGELRKYANKFTDTPDDPRWLFLHGSERFIRLLCDRGFKVRVTKKEDAPVGRMYDHYLGLTVVDKRGWVRGRYLGKPSSREGDEQVLEQGMKEFDESFAALKEKVAELLKE
jgi:cytochrome oxidase Cu insertion factor (SCO1/SenC/PrrC family)